MDCFSVGVLVSPGIYAPYIPLAEITSKPAAIGWKTYLLGRQKFCLAYSHFSIEETRERCWELIRERCWELMQEMWPGPYRLDWNADGNLVPIFEDGAQEMLWHLTYS